MLDTLFGNKTAEQILFYLHKNHEAYANELARSLKTPLNMVQKQLEKFKRGRILITFTRGNKKYYKWNIQWPYYKALQKFLSAKDQILKNQLRDPADGTYLSAEEKITLSEDLFREGEELSPHEKYKPFVKTFDSMSDYENWKKKQKNPWLV